MAEKKETLMEMDDVLKAAKKFVKQGKLDDLAEAWVENSEKAEEPNKLTSLLGQVGQFIKDNDVEDKLEDLLNEGTKTTKKKTSSTKKKANKKSTTTKKKTSTTKKSSTKKSTTTKKSK